MEAVHLDMTPKGFPEMGRPAPRSESTRPAAASAPSRPAAPDRSSLDQAAQELASHFKVNVDVVRDSSGRNVVRIMSPDGRRLLRQMPPEEVIRLADQARMGSIKGLLTFMV